ncbi:MAG: ammonia-forming cytochrome c nitrite reductase subunit c552 [Eggerthellaceae bacterium]|nr:ammonia-forming cytochrome c nitrite reductase subunit c552 [Eggerthellaceae bacterium]
MNKHLSRKRKLLTLAVVGAVALVLGLVACAPSTPSSSGDGTTSQEVQAPTPDAYGVITAAAWQETYPLEYASYQASLANAPGNAKQDYLVMYPALATLYAGNAFSKGYNEAAGHLYSLDSVRGTPRIGEASLQNCYSCKTPQYTALVAANGVAQYALPFAEADQFTEPISCYNCHGNDPQSLTIGNSFFVDSLGSDISAVPARAEVCGQCHNEYYFDPQTKATTNPYTGLAAMAPDAILAYYDQIGFSDWKYPTTETPMIKVQHPEFETVFGGGTPSKMAALGYTCADCHMGTATAEDGTEYTSHQWQSPLENQELLDTNCQKAGCHSDLKTQVKGWQDASEARVIDLSQKLETMVKTMVAQVEDGTLSGDKLAQMQQIQRAAQFYWDFVFVENSEGAHNKALSNATLDKCEALINEGMTLLG